MPYTVNAFPVDEIPILQAEATSRVYQYRLSNEDMYTPWKYNIEKEGRKFKKVQQLMNSP